MARRHRRRAILFPARPHDKGDDVAVLRAIVVVMQAFLVLGCAVGPSSPPGALPTMTGVPPGEAAPSASTTGSADVPADATPPVGDSTPVDAPTLGPSASPVRSSVSSPGPSPSTGEPTPRPPFTAAPIRSGSGLTITGTLSFDAIEGGCAFLETAEGTRYEILYPDGWSLDRGSGRLVGPDGRSVEPGGTITVRGSIATDMASTCQVGTIVRAVEVVTAGQ